MREFNKVLTWLGRVGLYQPGLLLAVCLLTPFSITADQKSSSLGQVVTPNPELPTNAVQCVEPVEVMRRDHMKFLMHQRDETVIDGIRTEKYSLTGCIDCHAQSIGDEPVVRADDPEFFCTECHAFTAVKIDCFECHSDRAQELTSSLDIDNSRSVETDLSPQKRLHQAMILKVNLSGRY